MRLEAYDWIVVNSSAGKDSQAMLDHVWHAAGDARSRMVVVHCDLGRVEWPGTRELAERQAKHYGLRFEVVRRTQNDLLAHIEARGKWPSNKQRYCTSEHKRGPVGTLFTRLHAELGPTRGKNAVRVQILNCLGMRAEESPARAKKPSLASNSRASTSTRTVTDWLPIHDWTEAQVWEHIHRTGVPYHPAYDLGMPRLSCSFCIFAPKGALMIAARARPELFEEYVALERRLGHSFRVGLPLAEVKRAVDAGEQPEVSGEWNI